MILSIEKLKLRIMRDQGHLVTKLDDIPDDFTLANILDFKSIDVAVWTLQCFDYAEYRGFLLKLVDSISHLIGDSDECNAALLAIKNRTVTDDIVCAARENAGEGHSSGYEIDVCASRTVISAIAAAEISDRGCHLYALDACNAAALAVGWDEVETLFRSSIT